MLQHRAGDDLAGALALQAEAGDQAVSMSWLDACA
jgi:hypothetical protein